MVWQTNGNADEKFQGVQNRALRRILGAVGTTAISVLHTEAGVMPLNERFRFLAEKRGLRLNYQIQPVEPNENGRNRQPEFDLAADQLRRIPS